MVLSFVQAQDKGDYNNDYGEYADYQDYNNEYEQDDNLYYDYAEREQQKKYVLIWFDLIWLGFYLSKKERNQLTAKKRGQ